MRRILLILAILPVLSLANGQKGTDVPGGTKANPNLIDVWDFGAAALDDQVYVNHLDSATINSWYAETITPGTSGNVLPSSWTAGNLSWTGGTNDRLRTTNLKLTRYDENIASVTDYTGRVYVNSSANVTRYLSLILDEDDEVTLIEKTDAGGKINFMYVDDPVAQTDVIAVTSALDTLNFVAKAAGTYRFFDTQGKPSYYRIYRKAATYFTLVGEIDETNAPDLPAGYGISFTNEAGKSWSATVATGGYYVTLPSGYTYTLSLTDANGYIISEGKTVEVNEETISHNISLLKVDLFAVGGKLNGLSAEQISGMSLIFTPDPAANKIYVPEPVCFAADSTYTVELEAGCEYTISATGINDYYLPSNTLTIAGAETHDLDFELKAKYAVTISTTGLTTEQEAMLGLTFTNLNEAGYVYSFSSIDEISLRDGSYAVSFSGLDDYPVTLALTSNLMVNGASAEKSLDFIPVHVWSFEDKVITSSTPSYKGMLFTGNIYNEIAKGHLACKPDGTIQVPMNPGEKMIISYYYNAAFSIEGGDPVITTSGSTGLVEQVEYNYTGDVAGYATITILADVSTTYLTEVATYEIVDYAAEIHVGADKEYLTVNEALDAIQRMSRSEDQRVTVLIDPGNYEEMLVVTQNNITLKNAAAEPSIELANGGVDIAAGAVRITGYYGHGYNYYSMSNDQKWHEDVLAVNKENGYLSYSNYGAGTTNGSYWNATVVISGSGFEAENIIFENSFNQYISSKEAEDVVVEWEVGGKGTRPTDAGNTAVQTRSFVERAAAIALANNTDKVILNNCRIVGRQDAFYGGTNVRVAVIKGAVMGAVDYIFGGMTAVFYKTELVMNTSDESVDASYLTAAQQTSGRGYLMYKCEVMSAVPGTETVSTMISKPGYFGRPWQATTSEVVFYKTVVDTSGYTGFEGSSLIMPVGWTNTLGGESSLMYEYGTIELSGEDNSASRAAWSTVLNAETLTDGTEITPFNFTKGSDDWDPITVETEELSVSASSFDLAADEGSNASVDITANVKWYVDCDQDWLSLSVPSGNGDGSLTFTATENTETTDRSATVTITGYWLDPVSVTITQAGSTIGIKGFTNQTLSVFPNPVSDFFTVNTGMVDARISVYDARGVLVLSMLAEGPEAELDARGLSNGLYFIKVSGQENSMIGRFVKK